MTTHEIAFTNRFRSLMSEYDLGDSYHEQRDYQYQNDLLWYQGEPLMLPKDTPSSATSTNFYSRVLACYNHVCEDFDMPYMTVA